VWRVNHGIILEQPQQQQQHSGLATGESSTNADSVAAPADYSGNASAAVEPTDATSATVVSESAPNEEDDGEEDDGVFDDVDLSSNETSAPQALPFAPLLNAPAATPAETPPAAINADSSARQVLQQQQQQHQLSSKLGRLSKAKSLPYRSPQTGAKIEGGYDVATTHVADILLHYMPFFMM